MIHLRLGIAIALGLGCTVSAALGQATAPPQPGPVLRAPASSSGAQTVPAGNARIAALIEQAQALLTAGKADEAWQLLEAQSEQFAGDPAFDYALGVAAADSGRPGLAIFALERVLLLFPNYLPARAEIARAYFLADEQDNARREFQTVSAAEIPTEARQTIARYMDAIERRGSGRRLQFTMLAEVQGGYDTNANFGSLGDRWVLGDGTAVTPLPASRPRPSGFMGAALGFSSVVPVSERVEWLSSVRVSSLLYPNVSGFDQLQVDGSTGLVLNRERHRLTVLAIAQHLQLDNAAFRNASGVGGQWQWEVNEKILLGLSAQQVYLDYPSADIRDARRRAVGLSAARLLDLPGKPILIGALSLGSETSRHAIDFLSHDFATLRAGVLGSLGPRWSVSLIGTYERREFDGAEPLFGVIRTDRRSELGLEFERKLDDKTSIIPQIVHTRNKSTLAPNDFRRILAGVQLRHRF